MAQKPLVSVVTPLFNGESYIVETVQSVLNQSYRHWELIIVDDASTDCSSQKVKTLSENEERISLLHLPENKGAAFCRNLATEMATGSYIAFLDSDDLWHPEKLEKQLQFMEENKCNVSYTSYLHIDEKGSLLHKRIVALPSLSYKKQHNNNYVGNLTGMYNAKAIGKIMAPNIRKRQDWALWLEAIKRNGKPALGLQEDLAFYRVRKGSMSSNKWNLLKYNFKFYKEYLGYSWLFSAYYLLRFLMEYFFVRPKYIQNL